MKKSKKIIITILSIICIILIVIIGYKIYEYCTEFHLDNANKYLVNTNNQSIGGNADNIYYGVDLEKAKVTKYEEFVSTGISIRIIHNQNLSENEVNELNVLLSNETLEEYNEENIKDKEESAKRNTGQGLSPEDIAYSTCYTVENMNYGEIDVYGSSFQEAFLDIVEN